MNLLERINISVLFFIVILFLSFKTGLAYVYVYEVTTSERRFHTASKLSPQTYLLLNGGGDTIKELKLMKVYADKDVEKAIKEFKLEKYNYRPLLPKNLPASNYYYEPFIWWR